MHNRDTQKLATLLFFLLLVAPRLESTEKQPAFVISRPTVIAFFAAKPNDADPDTNEALSDFQLYAGQARAALEKSGIEFHEVYTRGFRVKVGTQTGISRQLRQRWAITSLLRVASLTSDTE